MHLSWTYDDIFYPIFRQAVGDFGEIFSQRTLNNSLKVN